MAKLNNSDQPATKQDLDSLGEELRGEVRENRRKIDNLCITTSGLGKSTASLRKTTDGLKRTTDGLRKTTSGLKKTTNGLKKSVAEVKTTTDGLRRDVAGLKESDQRIAKAVIGLKEELRETKEGLQSQINEKFDKIMDGQDKVVTELKTIREEQIAHSEQHLRISDGIKDHEERIDKLENQVFA